MERQEIVNRLANLYKLIEKDLATFKDEANKKSLLDQRFGVRMAAQALQVWDEVLEKIWDDALDTINRSLTQDKS